MNDATRERPVQADPPIAWAACFVATLTAVGTSCSAPVVKPGAWDRELLAELEAAGRIVTDPDDREERVVSRDGGWLAVDGDKLTFVGLRQGAQEPTFALVLESDPAADRLAVLPLAPGETPLDVLAESERRSALRGAMNRRRERDEELPGEIVLSIRETVEEALLGPPVPKPRRILAVAANFESHLIHDLDVPVDVIEALQRTPPRVFSKYPPLPAPGTDPRPDAPFRGLIGPYDALVFPDVVSLPDDKDGVTHVVPTALDYEAELGIVLARRLGRSEVAEMSDDDLWDSIAGFVLVSDVKARNPQVFERILSRREVPTEVEQRYLTGDAAVDAVIGRWDEETCAWWGYAASQGDFAALGPFFVAAEGIRALPERDLLCARTYAPTSEREIAAPDGRRSGPLYLRQCARSGTSADSSESMLWSPIEVLRAVLSPRSALDLGPGDVFLERGDVIALGTPGGIALTVQRSRFYRWLDTLLFWWDARDWHDAFFRKDAANYLQQNDRVFLWGSGLGFQQLTVKRLKLPELPETIEDEEMGEVKRDAAEEAEEKGLEEEAEKAKEDDGSPRPPDPGLA